MKFAPSPVFANAPAPKFKMIMHACKTITADFLSSHSAPMNSPIKTPANAVKERRTAHYSMSVKECA